MKTIIAGSRNITDKKIVLKALINSGLKITEIVSGGARGVDKLGEEISKDINIPLKIFPADWNKYGKPAGYIRNKEMAEYADALVAIWDGDSRGTKIMIDIATKLGLKIFVYKTGE